MIDDKFVQAIAGLQANTERTKFVNGVTYALGNGMPSVILPPQPSMLKATTLQSVADYAVMDALCTMVSIGGAEDVVAYRDLDTLFQVRPAMIHAEAIVPSFEFGHYYSQEAFIINVQAKFKPTEVTARLLNVVGNLIAEQTLQQKDDGISQNVVAKTGIAKVEVVNLDPRVALAPYRSFAEVEPVESDFILRMRKDPSGIGIALFEADGGAWKIEQTRRIREFLEERLPSRVTILA